MSNTNRDEQRRAETNRDRRDEQHRRNTLKGVSRVKGVNTLEGVNRVKGVNMLNMLKGVNRRVMG